MTGAERQARYLARQKAEMQRLRHRERLEEKLIPALAVPARERRHGNALLERLLLQMAELRRRHGTLEPPQTPRSNRRRPLGHD